MKKLTSISLVICLILSITSFALATDENYNESTVCTTPSTQSDATDLVPTVNPYVDEKESIAENYSDDSIDLPFKIVHGTYSYDPELNKPFEEELKDDPIVLPFKVIHGIYSYDPIQSNNTEMKIHSSKTTVNYDDSVDNDSNGVSPKAVSIPTTYAPYSFYNVKHYWTANSYTWSSYIFTQANGYRFDCRAKKKFKVEFYRTNGVCEGSVTATYNSIVGGYWLEVDREYNPNPYYVKIVNLSGSPITNNAFYYVSDLSHALPLGPI